MKSYINFVVGHHKGLGKTRNGNSIAILYLDVPGWEIELVKKVSLFIKDDNSMLSVPDVVFDCPAKLVKNREGTEVARYLTRIIMEDDERPTISIIVRITRHNGYTAEVKHFVSFDQAASHKMYTRFLEPPRRTKNRMTVVPISNKFPFGIQLELSDEFGSARQTIANAIERHADIPVVVPQSYKEGKRNIPQWKLVRDPGNGLGVCTTNWNDLDYSKFELVSPPFLRREEGLQECYAILQALQDSHSVSIDVNQSMNFCVQVGAKNLDLLQLKKICWNFVKFEEAIDSFTTGTGPSRHHHQAAAASTSSIRNNHDYRKSSKFFLLNPGGSIIVAWNAGGGRHPEIDACNSLQELCDHMNPPGRYHKLNLRNLLAKQQPTIEFRQHSATAQPDKVLAWVRFCVAFVRNSAAGPIPEYHHHGSSSSSRRNLDTSQLFDELFDDVIQDQVLKKFFLRRRKELAAAEGNKRGGVGSSCGAGLRGLSSWKRLFCWSLTPRNNPSSGIVV